MCDGNVGLVGRKGDFSLQHWWLCCLSPKLPLSTSLSSLWDALSEVAIGLLAPSKLSEDLLPQRLVAQENLCLWMKKDTLKCGFRFHHLSGTSVCLGWEVWLKTYRSFLLLWNGRMELSRKLHPTCRAGNSCVWSHLSHSDFLGFSPHLSIPG